MILSPHKIAPPTTKMRTTPETSTTTATMPSATMPTITTVLTIATVTTIKADTITTWWLLNIPELHEFCLHCLA